MKSKAGILTRTNVYPPHLLKRRTRLLLLTTCLLFLLCTVGSASFISYQMYQRDTVLANEGVQHLQQAATLLKGVLQHPFETKAITAAQHEFDVASGDFTRLKSEFQLFPAGSTRLPIYGRQLKAAFALVLAALDVSHAGYIGCSLLRLLITRFQNPLTSKGSGLTSADFKSIETDAQQVVAALSQALDQLNEVQPGDVQFNARLSHMAQTARAEIPIARQWLSNISQLLPVLPGLLGVNTPAYYLIEVLDSSELRPGGGFIGNYGIATLSGGRLLGAHITDIDLIDRPFAAKGHTIAYPSAYAWFPLARESWSFRDSNLDADFPTAARFGEQNYQREGGNLPVQGVIAITPMLIQHTLSITGPIYIPEYQETITPENIIARIHYHQLGPAGEGPDTIASPDGHSSLRKRFTELLAEHFLERVHQLPPSIMSKFLLMLANGLHTKDLQLYFNANEAEAMLHIAHFDSTIAASDGDSLMVVDANVSPNKANSFIRYTMNDQVTIDRQGNAIHHTTLTYAWTIAGAAYGQPTYRDFVRVYVPPTSSLLQRNGLASAGAGSAFGREVWSGFLYLTYRQTQTIALVWKVPNVARKDAHGWHYEYEIQRQAGIIWQLHLQMTLPPRKTITTLQGGLQRESAQQVTSTSSLDEDRHMTVDYSDS